MDGNALAGGSASSRFVSETQLSEAQKKREEEVRASYARLGKDVPDDVLKSLGAQQEKYDPRSLYEKLQAQKDAKQEAWDEKHKLGNQFRGLDSEETTFLADVARQQREEQQRKELETRKELDEFRKAALAARDASPPDLGTQKQDLKATVPTSSASASATATNISKAKGKRKREGLLGVVKKKPSVTPRVSQQSPMSKSPGAKKDDIKKAGKDVSNKSLSAESYDIEAQAERINDIEAQAKRIKSTDSDT